MNGPKVIHIRNIQNDVTEDEIIALGYPFGKVANVLVLVGKEQAFIEMDDMFSGIVDFFYEKKFYPNSRWPLSASVSFKN